MTRRTIWSWTVMLLGALYFFVPLLATFEFSMRYRRGVYSFEAYRIVLGDPRFHETFLYSTGLALATIVVGILLVVPTAYWIQLRLPRLRPTVEFITLLPPVIPAIVLVFGYLPLTAVVVAATANSGRPTSCADVQRHARGLYMYRAPSMPGYAPSTSGRSPRRPRAWARAGDYPVEGHPAQRQVVC
jgi:hypothetical protein